jgi:beta-glucosidase
MPSIRAISQALLASLSFVKLLAAQEITSDVYFYGESPPVYPASQATGTGNWAASYAKAAAFVAQLSVEEKSNLTYGTTSETNGCSGNIPPIERLGFPGMCLQDAGNGVRGTDFVNGYPSGIHVGARYATFSNNPDWDCNKR